MFSQSGHGALGWFIPGQWPDLYVSQHLHLVHSSVSDGHPDSLDRTPCTHESEKKELWESCIHVLHFSQIKRSVRKYRQERKLTQISIVSCKMYCPCVWMKSILTIAAVSDFRPYIKVLEGLNIGFGRTSASLSSPAPIGSKGLNVSLS